MRLIKVLNKQSQLYRFRHNRSLKLSILQKQYLNRLQASHFNLYRPSGRVYFPARFRLRFKMRRFSRPRMRWKWNRKANKDWQSFKGINRINLFTATYVTRLRKYFGRQFLTTRYVSWRLKVKRSQILNFYGSRFSISKPSNLFARLDLILVMAGLAKNLVHSRRSITNGLIQINGCVSYGWNTQLHHNDIIGTKKGPQIINRRAANWFTYNPLTGSYLIHRLPFMNPLDIRSDYALLRHFQSSLFKFSR